MAIVGSNFTKILVEKNKAVKGKVKINNNISIKDVKSEDMVLGNKDEKGLKLSFDFSCVYEPDLGKINILGDLLVIEKNELADEVVKTWKEKKQVPKQFMANILNAVLTKCNVQSIILSNTMNLPPPIPMPSVTQDAMEKKPAEAKKEAKK